MNESPGQTADKEYRIEVRLSQETPLIIQLWAAMRSDLKAVELQDSLPEEPPAFTLKRMEFDSFDGGESFSASGIQVANCKEVWLFMAMVKCLPSMML